MRCLLVLAVVILALTPGCGGDVRTYSIGETQEAFAQHGYVLDRPTASQLPQAPEGVLVPRSGQHFFVFVGTDDDANDAWPDYERLRDSDSFDARRANVVVIADDGPPLADRKRVLAALAALPDRGERVEIAGG